MRVRVRAAQLRRTGTVAVGDEVDSGERVRRFEIRGAFAEWVGREGRSGKTVDGEVGYQVLEGTNRPRGGFRVGFRLFEWGGGSRWRVEI